MRPPAKNRAKRQRALLEPLEPRVLYSADPFGLGLETPIQSDLLDDGITTTHDLQHITDVFFVDQSVADHTGLASEIAARTNASQSIAVYTIDSSQTVSDISATLARHSNLNSLHIISHGYDSNVRLGASVLSPTTIGEFEDELSKWGHALSPDGDLLLYGCNLADSDTGKQFIESLSELTGADVAASEDLTGHNTLAGDWTLEYTTGPINAEALILEDGIDAWEAVLAPIEVDTKDDYVDGDLSSFEALRADPGPDGLISLREAILAANAEPDLNTIKLPGLKFDLDLDPAPGTDSSDQFIGDLDIWNSVHIIGDDVSTTTIDAKNLDRAISFLGGTSTIENITIQNGETNEAGGGILVKDSTLTLKNIDLHNNESLLERGGGIYADGAVTINIEDSVIRKNTAGKDLATFESGGAIHNWSGTVNLSRTEIKENKGSYGAGIFNHGLLNIKDSWLHLNVAQETGGAVYNEGSVNVERTLLERNTADDGGGLGNAGSGVIQDSTFAHNTAQNDGGAIASTVTSGGATGDLEIYRSTLADNEAKDNFGAIEIDAGAVRIQSTIIDQSITNAGSDINSGVISLGYNLTNASLGAPLATDLTNTDPKISNDLSDVGAFTEVYTLDSDSPAINGGAAIESSDYFSTQDVTGTARNEVSDIGAYEYKQSTSLVDLYWTNASTDKIYRGNSESKEYQEIVSAQGSGTSPVDIEVDIENNRIFWVETDSTNIGAGSYGGLYSARLDGSDPTQLAVNILNPIGLALDIENKQLFVTRDTTNNNTSAFDDNAIDRYTYDGTPLSPAIEGHHSSDSGPQGMESPVDVDYDSGSQLLVWSDRGNNAKGIHSLDSSGTQSTIVNSAAMGFKTPAGVAITPGGTSVYWNSLSTITHSNVSSGSEINSASIGGLEFFAGVQHHPETDNLYASTTGGTGVGRILAYDSALAGQTELYRNLTLPIGIASASLSAVNEAPSVETNTGINIDEAGTVTITRANLNSIDPNDDPQNNEFTITELPSDGELWVNDSRELTAASPTFTQSELTADGLQYRHRGAENTTDLFRFTVSDGALQSEEKRFDIAVNPINDPPQLTNLPATSLNYTENDGPLNSLSAVTIADNDDSNIESAVIKIDTGLAASEDTLGFSNTGTISGTWSAATGELQLTGSDTLANYELAIQSITYQNTSEDPDTTTRGISITVNDGDSDSVAATASINIIAENDAPVISSIEPTTLSYDEGDGKVAITDTVTLSDPDNTKLTSVTVKITSGYSNGQDTLSAVGFGAISWLWNPTSAELTLNSSSPQLLADYQAALRTVTFENNSTTPDTTPRVISVTANDGSADSTIASRTIEITATNTAPAVSLSGPGSYHEGDPYTFIDTGIVITDPDSINFDGGELEISITTGATLYDRVRVIPVGNGAGEVNVSGITIYYEGVAHGIITGAQNGDSPLTIALNNAATSTSVQAILRNVGYLNFSDSPVASVDYSVTLRDGDGGSATSMQSISITAKNDAPVITNLDGLTINARNDGTVYQLESLVDATVIDPDNPLNFDDGYLLVDLVNFSLDDSIALDSTGNISLSAGLTDGSILSVSGVIVGTLQVTTPTSFTFGFNSNATPARIDEIIHAFEFSSVDPFPGIRTINLNLTDGDGTLNGGEDTYTASINIVLGSADRITASEDTSYTFVPADFDYTGFTGSNLRSITVTSLPSTGSLLLNSNPVTIGQEITRSEIDSGQLTFDPVANTFGTPYTAFDFYVNTGNASINVLSGHDSNYTLDSYLTSAANIITNDDHFSPAGTVTTNLSIQNSTGTIDNAYLSNGRIMFSGFMPDGTLSATELSEIDTWVQNGGILIATGDLSFYDDITDFYGLPVTSGGNTKWNVDDTANPIITGKFGTVSTIYGVGYGGHFETADLATDDLVLASHSTTGNPSVVLREHGDGHILFASDEGVFRQNTTGDGTINTDNDVFIANVFAWAADAVAPETFYNIDIDVNAVNDNPQLTLPDAPSYTENAAPVLIMPNATLSDNDSANLNGGAITITPGTGASAEDSLGVASTGSIVINSSTGDISYSGTVIANASGGESGLPLSISLNANSDLTNTQALLRAITFSSTENNPQSTVGFSTDITDGDGGTDTKTSTISIDQVNDDPGNTGAATISVTVTEDIPSPLDLSSVILSDADSGSSLMSLTLSVSASGRLTAASQTGITITGSNTNSVSIDGSLIDLNNYLSNPALISYLHNDANKAGAGRDTMTINLTDNGNTGSGGGANITLGTVTINIAPQNDDPTNTGSLPVELRVAEDTLDDLDLSAIKIRDVDDGGSSMLTVRLETSNNGELQAAPSANILTGGSSTAITLQGTLNNLNTYLDNVTNLKYQHPLQNFNGNNADSISVWVNDNGNTGAGGGTDISFGTVPIHIDAVNDAPQLSTDTTDLDYTENDGKVAVSENLALTDIDTTFLNGASVSLTSGYTASEDILNFINNTNITGSWNNTNGSLNLTGTATVAQYEAALQSITYENSSENPATLSRVVTFKLTDGDNTVTATRTINVDAVNDRPVISLIEAAPQNYTENDSPTAITASGSLADVDNVNLQSARLKISSGYQSGEDSLSFTNNSGITGNWDQLTGTLTLTGNTTVALFESALRSVTYQNSSEHPDTTDRVVSISASDGMSNSVVEDRIITVDRRNDAPDTGSVTLAPIEEDDSNPTPSNIGSLIAPQFTDSDADNTLKGIAIVANTATITEGEWQYATDAITWKPVGSTTTTVALALDTATWLRFLPAANYNGTPPALDFRAIDSSYTGPLSDDATRVDISTVNNGGTTAISTSIAAVSITVNAVNDAPVVSTGAELPDIFEDTSNPAGETVADSFNGLVSDIDSAASFEGIAITAAPNTDGDWQYSINGTDWSSITAVSSTNALALDTAAQIRFVPGLHYNGSPSPLSIHAIDNTYTGLFTTSAAPAYSNAQAFGGQTEYSLPGTLSIDVTSVNDRPMATDADLPDILEDDFNPAGTRIGTLYSGNFNDVDGTMGGIAIHRNLASTEGQWQYTIDGTAWIDINTVSISNALVLKEDNGLRFNPSANYNGAPPAIAVRVIDDTFTGPYTSSTGIATTDLTSLTADSGISSSDSQVKIEVLAVNDSPDGQNATLTMNEGAVHTYTASDFGFSDILDSHSFNSIVVDSLPLQGQLTLNGVAVTATQVILVSDINANQLEYTPPVQANGSAYAQWNFTVVDNGGTANFGSDQSAFSNTLTMDVKAVNDAPLATDFSTTILEDNSLVFTQTDFGFSDPNDGHLLYTVELATLPASGTLSLNGAAVTTGTTILASDITLGRLTYQPVTDEHGTPYDQFDFYVTDDGGTTNGGTDKSIDTKTVFIDVVSVNDPPTAEDNTLTALEDIEYTFSESDFGFEDTKDPDILKAITIITPPDNGTLALSGLPVSPLDILSAADISAGKLAFLAAPDENGANYTNIEFRVIDSGDNTNGGQAAAIDSNVLSINVLAVNDRPSGVDNTVSTAEDTSYQFKETDFGLIDPPDGHTLDRLLIESASENGDLTNNGITVTSGTVIPISDITAGNLLFTPAGNLHGDATSALKFRAIDNGGVANGGIDTASAVTTITIDVASVNDSPTGQDSILEATEDTPLILDSTIFGFSDIDTSDTMTAVIIDAVTGPGQLLSQGVSVMAGEIITSTTIDEGTLSFLPDPHTYGNNHTLVEFRLMDSGDTAGDLHIAASSNFITFNVAPVNDAPHAIDLTSVQVNENSAGASVAVLAVQDYDPTDSHTVTVDDDRFQVIDERLLLQDDVSLDFENEPEIALVLTATDEAGSEYNQPITLQVIDSNDAPVPASESNEHAAVAPFAFALPEQSFSDEDGDALSYTATLENGDPLPLWLKFDPATLEFTVNEPDTKIDSVKVTVVADDGNGKTASMDINIALEPAFAPALPAEAPAEVKPEIEPEPAPEEETEKPVPPAPPAEEPAPNFDEEAKPTSQIATEQEQALPEPPTIHQGELFTELEIEIIKTTQSKSVTQANESFFIDIQNNISNEQRARETLITKVALSKLATQMDSTKQTMRETNNVDQTVLNSSVTMASSLSVGYIFWILRSGTLIASILTSLPAWRYIDPLPVLDSLNDDENENDRETLESMVEKEEKPDEPETLDQRAA